MGLTEASGPTETTEASHEPVAAPPADEAPTISAATTASPESIAPRPTLGPSPGPITVDDSFAQAGRKVMWVQVERFLKFEPALRDPAKTDALKRFRVATRRLRAALRLFGDAYPESRVRALRTALGDLGRTAGAVRDLDVRLADLDRWASGQDGDAAEDVEPLRAAWRGERERAAATLVARLETKRHARLVRELVAFVDGEGRVTAAGSRSVRDTAASRLWRALETLREAGALVRWTDLPAVHEVRIDAKRLRYGLEFFADVLPPTRLLLVQRLVALQDHLGAINDAAVTATAVRLFLADPPVPLTPGQRSTIARYVAGHDRELALHRRGIGLPWRPVASAAFARRFGRTVVIP